MKAKGLTDEGLGLGGLFYTLHGERGKGRTAHLSLGDFQVSSETVVGPVGEGPLLNLLPRVVHAFPAERLPAPEHPLDLLVR